MGTPALRSQVRTNVPGDVRIVGRVNNPIAASPAVTGRQFTFLYSGVAGIYYLFFGSNVTATFDGAGDTVTLSGSSTVLRVNGWNLQANVVAPETPANVRSYFATPIVAPGGSFLSKPVGLQIKSVIPGGGLANPANVLDGFAFEIMVSYNESQV